MIDWAARLAPGETLLWQGRPVPPARPNLWMPMDRGARIGLTALLAGLGLVMGLAFGPRLGPPGWLALAPLIGGLGFGVWFFNGGQERWTAFWLDRTRYALTDARARVAVRALGRWWVQDTPVTRFTPPRLAPQGAVGHVVFRTISVQTQPGLRRQSHVRAFWYLPDAPQVLALIQALRPPA